MAESTCPSCGLRAPLKPGLPAAPLPASPECWEKFGELTCYDLDQAGEGFPHQTSVDAYTAQHPGYPTKRVALWFALAGLHLALEAGWSGWQVQVAHGRLAHLDRVGPELPTVVCPNTWTVHDVLAAHHGSERDAARLEWAGAVWRTWEPHHVQIAARLPPRHRLQ